MKMNMGSADRGIRVVVGLVIVFAGIYFKSWWGVIGVVLLSTALIGFCPGYVPFGISTKKP